MNVFSSVSQERCLLGLMATFLCFCSGCSGTYDSTVSGVVTLDSTPLTGGSVSYIPNSPGPASYAVVLGDGSYTVNTGREVGLPAGEYTVTVMAREKSIEDTSGRGLPPLPGKQITPPWYSQKKSSPLKFSITSGSNDINLELSSDPPPDWNPPRRTRR